MSGGVLPPGQMALAAPLPMQRKAPLWACEGQKRPPASEKLAVPVVMGVRFTGNEGRALAAGGAQSYVSPAESVGVHAFPSSGDAPKPAAK